VNDWLLLIVMSLGSYRLTRLVVTDDFPPVLWVRDRLAGGLRPATEGEQRVFEDTSVLVECEDGALYRNAWRAAWVPEWLAALVSCSWCASGWVSLVVVMGAAATTGVAAPVLTWWAVWALSALIAGQDWA